MTRHIKVFGAVLALGFLAIPSVVMAEEIQWQKDHPRRTEVNQRLNNQNKRIDQGVKNGKLSSQQAGQLHKEDHQIHNEKHPK
jgi:hypothetical protein